jgi:hypothetical protein
MRSGMGILPMKKRPHRRDAHATFRHSSINFPAPISLLPRVPRIALIPRIQMTRAFPNFHTAQPLLGALLMARSGHCVESFLSHG